jgi:hypothetical protein
MLWKETAALPAFLLLEEGLFWPSTSPHLHRFGTDISLHNSGTDNGHFNSNLMQF